MLATRLGSVLANRATLLVIVLATIIVTTLAVQIINMSLELENKNKIIDIQDKDIDAYITAIDAQKQDIEDKTMQLNKLNIEIASRSQEVDILGTELSSKNEDLIALQAEAQRLQQEITLLQLELRLTEQNVAGSSKQLELAEQGAKRIKISHSSLAVVNDKNGIAFPIEVEIINPGTGAILVDVSDVQYEDAFQGAVRTAAAVASEYTGESIADKDIILRIIDYRPELTTIDGNSAGALIAGMIVAGLTDKDISDKVLVTGTINPNGTVGKVGSMEEKIEVALDIGASILLVPESQEFDSKRIVVVGVSDIDEVVKYLVVSK